MPRQVAALICTLFIAYAFWRERKESRDVSAALWVPQIWVFLAGSRYVSQWFNLGASFDQADVYMEGNPVDRAVFLLLIVAAVIGLARRRVDWGKVVGQNWWIWSYFLFGAASVFWSDYPLASSRRLPKAFGNVIMALVVLTEKQPAEAAMVVLRRLALLMLPLSVLFIKYYPELGRAYHHGSWGTMYIGATLQKNSLGALCMLSGISFCWTLLQTWGERSKPAVRASTSLNVVFLFMIAWLLYMANSATAIVCLLLAAGILVISQRPSFRRDPQRIMVLGIAGACVLAVLNMVVDISGAVAGLFGRDESLTTRVPMWQGLREMAENPLVGSGFESFWLGDRLEELWKQYGRLNQAHNGYLEVYLNLGLVGVALVVGSILSGLGKVWRHLRIDYTAAVQRLCFIVTIAVYNYTEATFHGVSNLWLVFFLGVLDMPRQAARGRVPATSRSYVEKIELVSGAAAANVSRLESDGHRPPFVREGIKEGRVHGSEVSDHRRDE